MKYQQAESLSVSLMLIVCTNSGIKQKVLLDTLKSEKLNGFTKISTIKKTKSYIGLLKLVKSHN